MALAYEPGPVAPTDRLLSRAQQAVRRDTTDASAWTNLAALLLRRRRETSDASLYLRAEDALRAAREHGAAGPRIETLHAMLLIDRHRFDEAADVAARVIASAPDDPTGHLLLGDARLEVGHYEAALDAYQTAMDLRPDLRSYERGAHLRWLHGDVDGAVELLAMAIDSGSARDPESMAWCWVELGRIEHARGRHEAALSAAGRAGDLVPEYLPAIALEARALAALGRRGEAIARMEEVVRRSPSVSDLCALAEWLAFAGRTDASGTRLSQARRLAEEDPGPLALHLARHARDADETLRLAQRQLEDRRTVRAWDVYALALLRAGRLDDARDAIEHALALGTPEASFHLHAALIHRARGDTGRADASLARALSLDPTVDPLLVEELRGES